jgi:hypothetical protein
MLHAELEDFDSVFRQQFGTNVASGIKTAYRKRESLSSSSFTTRGLFLLEVSLPTCGMASRETTFNNRRCVLPKSVSDVAPQA